MKRLKAVDKKLTQQLSKQNYPAALDELAGLKDPVDNFFSDVMIMDENQHDRDNRLAILQELRRLFVAVADISQL